MNKGYLPVNGTEIYYEKYGEGQPMMLLHGNGQSIRSFQNQIDFFKRHFQVIAIDSRCHGRSKKGAFGQEFDYETLADDLYEVMEKLDIPKAHMLGWSDGGITGLIFARKRPEKVISLCVMGANYETAGLKLHIQSAVGLGYYATLPFVAASKKIAGYNKLYKLMKNHPHITEAELEAIDCPVLIVVGSRDFVKRSHTKKMAKLIKNSEMVVIQHSNHFAPVSHKDVFNQAVLGFIRSKGNAVDG